MFRIAHVSDIHADYRATRIVTDQGINIREADGYKALSVMMTDIIKHDVDVVVIAGDTFHTPSPSVRSVIFVQNQLRRLWKANIPVYILSGNHDVTDVKSDIASSRILHDPWRKIYSHAEPYVTHRIGDGINLHMVSHHMYHEQAETMKNIHPVKNEINIFTTHGSCIDPILEMKLHTEQSPREIVIPDSLLKDNDWDYSLLGHIHERGWVGSTDKKTDTMNTKIYYNGSLIRRGFSDKEMPLGRGWTLWEIDDNGQFTAYPQKIAQRSQEDFPIIDARKLSSKDITDIIIEHLKNTVPEDYNDKMIKNVAPILRQRIANITPSKYAGIDQKAINTFTQHALSWEIKTNYIQESLATKKSDNDDITYSSHDVVEAYDDWIQNTESLKEYDDAMRERVTEQARNFVQQGQDEELSQEL